MKITNKFKIIYGYIILFMLLLSTIIPYHKITHLNYLKDPNLYEPESITKYKSILLNPISSNIIILIIICITVYIIMHYNIIYKKKSNKKIIKTKWILINTLLLCIGAFTMEIAILKEYMSQTWCGQNTWCGQIGSSIITTRFLGFYIYILSIVLLFIYWIIIKKNNIKKQ